jgi:hypothetical protein
MEQFATGFDALCIAEELRKRSIVFRCLKDKGKDKGFAEIVSLAGAEKNNVETEKNISATSKSH